MIVLFLLSATLGLVALYVTVASHPSVALPLPREIDAALRWGLSAALLSVALATAIILRVMGSRWPLLALVIGAIVAVSRGRQRAKRSS
ncbi:MAG: hypothetical protein KC503_43220 [Myxococcales bacterium]|nr:hypothetical protein [Myxococcales bacterium]